MTTQWQQWGPESFLRAAREKKPVLLHLRSGEFPSGGMEAAYADEIFLKAVGGHYVLIQAGADERPDLFLRYGRRTPCAMIIDFEGNPVAEIAVEGSGAPGLAQTLLDYADSYVPPEKTSPQTKPVWTGAVGAEAVADSGSNRQWPALVVSSILEAQEPDFPCLDCLELLLYCAGEWKDAQAGKRLAAQLSRLAEGPCRDEKSGGFARPGGEKSLVLNSRLARIYLDAYSLTRVGFFREIGQEAVSFMVRELYAPASKAFMNCRPAGGRPVFYADANAMAVLALFKASAFPEGKKHLDTANQVLVFLPQMFDPARGMAHFWVTEPGPVYGLLGDNAWVMLAFTESFFMAGHKPHREFADALLRHMFQDLWEREHGGFLDRTASPDDLGALKIAHLPISLNALAFEGAWRLHELKGNANYKKWVEWGLGYLVPQAQAQGCPAALARIVDIVGRGRLDLELVGKVGDSKTDAFLTAIHQHYLPRKIISFVDPDDQDYIMAHRLQAKSYPRLFGCIDLKPKIDVDSPDKVTSLLASITA